MEAEEYEKKVEAYDKRVAELNRMVETHKREEEERRKKQPWYLQGLPEKRNPWESYEALRREWMERDKREREEHEREKLVRKEKDDDDDDDGGEVANTRKKMRMTVPRSSKTTPGIIKPGSKEVKPSSKANASSTTPAGELNDDDGAVVVDYIEIKKTDVEDADIDFVVLDDEEEDRVDERIDDWVHDIISSST